MRNLHGYGILQSGWGGRSINLGKLPEVLDGTRSHAAPLFRCRLGLRG